MAGTADLRYPGCSFSHQRPLLPSGGWDAWSCWNLKAKFIFLGHENWKDVLAPGLWRSNTHYPLLWPLINVWFWDLGGHFDQAVPMLNSIVFALLTAGILLFGLLELTGMLWASISSCRHCDRFAFRCDVIHKPIQRCPAGSFSVVSLYVFAVGGKI